MAIGDDFSVASNGDIRYVGTTANYTVIAFHRWLGDLMDDAQAAGNDLLDITDATASERSTDNIVTLNSPYNIDDIAARHLYDGSIIQGGGSTTIYDGILVFATAGAYLNIMQTGKLVTPNFWTTGLNADATNGISHRFMLKVRSAGTDIDGRRLIGWTREFGFTYSEFKINGTSRGNNVMALTYATDLNNQTAIATVKGWTDIANTTEGYKLLDVDGNGSTEPYFSEWNRASRTINQFYERMKWITKRAVEEATYPDTGTDANYAVGNATTLKQGQSFAVGTTATLLTRAHAKLKKVGSPTGNIVAKVYASDGASPQAPTGAALATSVNVDVAKLTTTYAMTEFGFDTQVLLTASTNYFISFEYSGGDASNYVHLEGDSAGGYASQNRAAFIAAWAGDAASDLYFSVYTSPKLYGLPGEWLRGITHEIVVDTPTGTFAAFEAVSWSGGAGQMFAINSTTAPTKMWIQLLTGVAPTDGQTITGVSLATADVNVTVTERTLSYPFIGQSTGSAIIGAYGIGVETLDLTASDKLFDLDNTQRVPPNVVTFTVSGLISGEDRVLVGPEAGGTFNLGERTLATALTAANETAVVVNSAIPSDTPTAAASSRTIRIELNSGIYRRVVYATFTGSTYTLALPDTGTITVAVSAALTFVRSAGSFLTDGFAVGMRFTSSGFTGGNNATKTISAISTDGLTITVTDTAGLAEETPGTGDERLLTIGYDFTADNASIGNDAMRSFIDVLADATSEAFSVVYAADRSLYIRVRDGGGTPIKTFESTATLGSAGGSATTIRTADV